MKEGFPEVTSKLSYPFRIGVRQQHWGQMKGKGRGGRDAPQGMGREEDCSTGEQKVQKSRDKKEHGVFEESVAVEKGDHYVWNIKSKRKNDKG